MGIRPGACNSTTVEAARKEKRKQSYFKKIRSDAHFCTLGIGKAIPLHAWTGPEGSRRLRLSDFKAIGT
jgi:hypothetical protein